MRSPQTTANMLIEINDAALTVGSAEKHLHLSTLTEIQEMNLATGIAKTAALDYVQSESEFSRAIRCTDLSISILSIPPIIFRFALHLPKFWPNDSKVWRLAESEAECKLRSKPVDLRIFMAGPRGSEIGGRRARDDRTTRSPGKRC